MPISHAKRARIAEAANPQIVDLPLPLASGGYVRVSIVAPQPESRPTSLHTDVIKRYDRTRSEMDLPSDTGYMREGGELLSQEAPAKSPRLQAIAGKVGALATGLRDWIAPRRSTPINGSAIQQPLKLPELVEIPRQYAEPEAVATVFTPDQERYQDAQAWDEKWGTVTLFTHDEDGYLAKTPPGPLDLQNPPEPLAHLRIQSPCMV